MKLYRLFTLLTVICLLGLRPDAFAGKFTITSVNFEVDKGDMGCSNADGRGKIIIELTGDFDEFATATSPVGVSVVNTHQETNFLGITSDVETEVGGVSIAHTDIQNALGNCSHTGVKIRFEIEMKCKQDGDACMTCIEGPSTNATIICAAYPNGNSTGLPITITPICKPCLSLHLIINDISSHLTQLGGTVISEAASIIVTAATGSDDAGSAAGQLFQSMIGTGSIFNSEDHPKEICCNNTGATITGEDQTTDDSDNNGDDETTEEGDGDGTPPNDDPPGDGGQKLFFDANEHLDVSETIALIYPNPASDRVKLLFATAKNGKASVRLLDNQNQVVRNIYNGTVKAGMKQIHEIETSDLAAGVYFLQVIDPDGAATIQKLLKQ